MSDTVIRVENLGKRYQLGRNAGQNGAGYRTLRETLSDGARNLFQRPASRVSTEEFWALRDVSFEVKQGEVVGIIGRNGAGKSTLLKVLSRITEPTNGRISITGRVASLLEVGTGFHPELTGRENIFLNGAILGMSRAEIKAKFDEIVAFAEVDRFLATPVKRYSSGMYVRLAFAVAAHLEPEILIVDEVLAVGDAEFQRKCLGKMGQVARGGRTVLFVSHDLQAIGRLCSHAILLQSGAVEAIGETRNVIRKYRESTARVTFDYTNRTGEGDIQVVEVEALGASGAPATQFHLFEPVRFRLRCVAKREVSGAKFAVCFNTPEDVRSLSLYSSYYGQSFHIKPGTFTVECAVPSLRLMPGDYQLLTHVEAGGVLLDAIADLQTITVLLPAGSGFDTKPDLRQGFSIEQFSWTEVASPQVR